MATFVQYRNNAIIALMMIEDHEAVQGPIFTFGPDERMSDPWSHGLTGSYSFMKWLLKGHRVVPGFISVPFSNGLEWTAGSIPEARESLFKVTATPEQVIQAFELEHPREAPPAASSSGRRRIVVV